jgi:hypothetical protein
VQASKLGASSWRRVLQRKFPWFWYQLVRRFLAPSLCGFFALLFWAFFFFLSVDSFSVLGMNDLGAD